jgi:Ulp1 family protease
LLIEDYASNELVKQNVLFLSSHFYSRLRAGKGTTMRERLAAGYKNVSTWLTRSDLFSRTLVFVPINKE